MVRNKMDEDRNGSRSPSPGVSRSGSRNSLNNGHCGSRTSIIHRNQTQSAKQIIFYRNSDQFFGGLKLAVSAEKYKTFTALLEELSKKLSLGTGAVRNIFDAEDGREISDISQLHHGTAYVCSSSTSFDRMDGKYGKHQKQWSLHSKGNNEGLTNWGGSPSQKRPVSKKYTQKERAAKLVTVFKNSKAPRVKVTMILNHRILSLEQVLDDLSAKLTLGKVDKLYTKSGKLIRELDDLFEDDTTQYIALSCHERFCNEGLMSDINLSHRTTPYRDLKRPSTGGLKRSSSVRTPRKRRDSGGSECDSGRHPVRRSQSVKGTNSGRSSRGRSASPGPMNGHTPRSKSPKSPSSPGKKTPNGMGNGNEELYPAQVFEKDSSDTERPDSSNGIIDQMQAL